MKNKKQTVKTKQKNLKTPVIKSKDRKKIKYNTNKKKNVKSALKTKKTSSKKKSKTTLISSTIPITSTSSQSTIVKKQRKKRTKNVSKIYFTDETENAIIEFNKCTDEFERNAIFNSKIKFPFEKLIENIFNKFKFSYFETSPDDVQKECLTHMVANIHKFDPSRCSKDNPNKKAKAYSFFSIVAKNFFILLNNGNYKRFNQNIEIGEDKEEHTVQLQQVDKYYHQVELSDFMQSIIKFWDMNIEKIFPKLYDLRIASAVVDLLRKSDYITMFNKKALYLYIRDIADCKTSHVTKIIKKMKIYQTKFEEEYYENGYINYELSAP